MQQGIFGNVVHRKVFENPVPTEYGKFSIIDSPYSGYAAFLWLMTCTDSQFRSFLENGDDSFGEYIWAYNFVKTYLCKK